MFKNGIILLILFGLCSLISQVLRNYQYFLAYKYSVEARRTLLSLIYDKVGKLSMQSLLKTNASKLITIISSDLFQSENGLSYTNFVLASPLINIVAYTFIGIEIGFWYSLGTFVFWLFIFALLNWLASQSNKVLLR